MVDKVLLYKKRVIKALYFHPQLSCAELSVILHKSVPLITKVLDELIAEGNVSEKGYAPSTGGRRPTMYSLRSSFLYIVSIDMHQLITRISILDAHNKA